MATTKTLLDAMNTARDEYPSPDARQVAKKFYQATSKPKTRTPADIGREIAEAKRRIVELNAELATVPPSVLELQSRIGRTVEFEAEHNYTYSGPRICVRRTGGTSREVTAGLGIELDDVPRIRAWLNHYYPEA